MNALCADEAVVGKSMCLTLIEGWHRVSRLAPRLIEGYSSKAGTAFQTVVKSFPLPEHLRPYGFKKAENNFKPYFVGNIITLSSMLGLRRASPDGSLLIAPCRCGQAVQHCLNIIALSSMFGLRRASPDGFTFRFDVRCLGTQAGSGGAFQ